MKYAVITVIIYINSTTHQGNLNNEPQTNKVNVNEVKIMERFDVNIIGTLIPTI